MHHPLTRPASRPLLRSAALLCCLLAAVSATAQGNDAPPDPEIERRSFKVADGFEVSLFAAEPAAAKPIQINFDPQGRLWVATSTIYPQVKPGEAPDDKVLVLEDTDGDGKAEKSTVFAGGLLIPTGVLPGDGGAYVANSTELVHFADTDGDLKADSRRVVLSGFGTEDTHHIIHTFRWGPDGRFFFNQSIYIHSHVETPWGPRRLNGSGTWRFDPRDLRLEVYSRGMVNPWGLAWDRWGQSFGTDGAGFGGIHYQFPGSAYETAVDVKRTLRGLNANHPKYCGLEYADGRHLPEDWRGSFITCDFRANRVVRFKVDDEDGAYVAKLMPDVITSTDRAFRPIDVKMGPDGAIYVADWYNPIINHGEVDFRDPRRDKTHGRIWRITAKGRPLVERPKLVGAPVKELLDHLKAPEQWTRQAAKDVLRERGAKEVVPALAEWVKGLRSNGDAEHHRLEALWTHQTLNVPEPGLLKALLDSTDHRIREAATRVVPDWAARMPDALDLLAARVADEHPRVRLEAVCALARIPDLRAIEVAVRVREKPTNNLIDYALEMAANELEPVWMPAFKEGKLTFGGNQDHLNYALRAVESVAALEQIRTQLSFNTAPRETRESMLDALANLGGPGEASLLMQLALRRNDQYDGPARARLLARVERMTRERNVRPGGNTKELGTLITGANEPREVKLAALRLAGLWKREDLRALMEAAAVGPHGDVAAAEAGIRALAELGGEQSAAFLRRFAQSDTPPRLRSMVIEGLASLDLKAAAAEAADLLSKATGDPNPPNADPGAVLGTFLQREGGAEALAAALEGKKLPPDVAKLGLRYVNKTGRDDPALTTRLREAAGLAAERPPPTAQELAALVTEVQQKGDPARGEAVFRRAEASCFQCHAIGGAGGSLGPDLRAIGASAPVDYLIESILTPDKAIKEGYHSVVVATKDGQVYNGIKVGEDERQVVLRDATRDRIPLAKADIRRQREGRSLMPAGLADVLTHGEFIDLVRFLSELGKPGGQYAATNAPGVIRRWRVLDPDSANAAHVNDRLLEPGSIDSGLTWLPAYANAAGVLPADAWVRAKHNPVAFARGEIEVTAPGRVALHLNDPTGLSVWVNGRPVEAKPQLELDLPRGVHTAVFKIDLNARGRTPLRAEVRDQPGSTGHAQPVGGA